MTTDSGHGIRRQPKESVEDLLKEYIVVTGARPGDRLPGEIDLASELGVSRNVIRESLRSLQALGIVDIKHGLGAYLSEQSFSSLTATLAFWSRIADRDGQESLRPIAEVREILEINLLDRVIGRHTEADILALEQSIRDMRKAAADGSYARDADLHFHETLFKPLENWVLLVLMRAFWDAFAEVGAAVAYERKSPELVVEQHAAILEAVRAGDVALSRALMATHFDNPLRRKP